MTQQEIKNRVWKDSFGKSNKKHLVSMQKCPSCGVYETPQPISIKIWENYPLHNYECDGCSAYKDHLL
jgi:hypothetical protein